ncbi:MAG: serine hydrolase domain-containing protein [Thermoleophilia bacterium]
MNAFDGTLDAVLHRAVGDGERLAGAVAMVTSREQTLYSGSVGVRSLGADAPMTTDTVFALFSATKPLTATAVLQCVEEGLLNLDAPASQYVPAIGDLHVLVGFDADEQPVLRAPCREITTRMLMLHTAGFAYDVFNESYSRLTKLGFMPSVGSAQMASLMSPLLFDPGERWEYGISMDWAGLVVEAIRGQRLGDVMAERIFGPLGMIDTGFTCSPSMRSRLATIHARGDGVLVPLELEPLTDPEVHMGGSGLYSTVADYMRFLPVWLGDGTALGHTVLRPETIAFAVENGLQGDQRVVGLPSTDLTLSRPVEFFPGLNKSWAYSFMVNDEDAPTGRAAGSLAWGGLANVFLWIDRRNSLGGVWATQLLPFCDDHALGAYLEFETAVYAGGMPQQRDAG